MSPELTIIIPVYNVEEYLADCLESICNQTDPHFVVQIVDDGSSDNSASICKQYCNHDSRFRYVYQRNSGLGAARNKGMEMAETEWITFVDSDDWLDERYVELMLEKAKNTKADIVYCDFYAVSEKERKYVASRSIADKGRLSIEDRIMLINDCSLCYALYNRENIWKKSEIRMPEFLFEDSAIYGMVISAAKDIACIPAALYYYRTDRPESLMKIGRKSPYNMLRAMQFHFDSMASCNLVKYRSAQRIFAEKKIATEWNFWEKRLNESEREQYKRKILEFMEKNEPGWRDVSPRIMSLGSYIPTMVYNNLAMFRETYESNYVFSSIIGLMSSTSTHEDIHYENANPYRISMITKELQGEWIHHLEGKEWILFDLLEERNDIVCWNDTYITKSEAFDEIFGSNVNRKIIPRNSEECWCLWKEKFDSFIKLIMKNKITPIMIETYLSEHYESAGQLYSFENNAVIQNINRLLGKYYSYVKEKYPEISVISIDKEDIYTSGDFFLGCKPWYYNSATMVKIESSIRRHIGLYE